MHELFARIVALLRGVWRYRWVTLLIAWVVSLAGWVYVSTLPDQYEASAQVHVDTNTLLRPLLSGLAVEPDTAQRVDLMTRTLLTRPILEQVVRDTDLYLRALTEADMEQIIVDLREGITIEPPRTDNRGRRMETLDIYKVAFTSREPRQAYEVVHSLLNAFVEGLLGEARGDSEIAQRFVDQQIREYEQRLEAAEERLARFRMENAGLLPGDRGDHYQRLQRATEEHRQTEIELREAVNRRNELQRQYDVGYRSLTPTLDARVENVKMRLDELTSDYTERHPEIISLRRTLADLEQQRREEVQRLRQGIRLAGSSEIEGNAAYQEMRRALSNAQVDVSALSARAAAYRDRIDELEEVLDRIPLIEAELQRLDRDYEVNLKNFEEFLSRRERAALSQTMEASGEQVQFRVIEPPRVPMEPYAPNRRLWSAAVLFLGFGTGAGFSLLISQLRPVFEDRRSVTNVTGFPVLGTVAQSLSTAQRLRERGELFTFLSVAGALMLVFVLVVVLGGIPLSVLERM